MPAKPRQTEDLSEYAKALIAGLQTIPVEELVQCARRGLTATRRIRLSKDDPEGIEEPDHASQQKALAFIADQTGGKAGQRVLPPVKVESADDKEPGKLVAGK